MCLFTILDDEIKKKISKAWCEEANIQNNPLLEIARTVIFHEFEEVNVERPEKVWWQCILCEL